MFERQKQWMALYGRVYKDTAEEDKRFNIFKDNVERIESFNKAANKPYKLGVNQFVDLTNEEFKLRNRFKSHVCSTTPPSIKYENVTAVPTTTYWRKKGVVTPIKDQGQCGKSLLIATLVAKIKVVQGVSLTTLSNSSKTIKASIQKHTTHIWELMTLATKTRQQTIQSKITGYEDVPTNSESALLKADANQPIFVAIDASGSDFQFYSGGVFTGACGTELGFGVTAIGYGTGTKYWLTKNSWGTSWGEEAYIRMQRDIDAKEALYSIAMVASYPPHKVEYYR
ncbi:hypothetical protein ACSBR1_027914 [Camellia fascicularis]